MRTRLLGVLAGLALLLGGLVTPADATPTTAAVVVAGELEIRKVGYNANGTDVPSNAWKEYIDLTNVSGHAVNVEGWSTQDTWADREHGDNPEAVDCNTAVFATGSGASRFQHLTADNPDTTEVETDGVWLPAGEHIRVYTGGSVDRTDNAWHTIALNKSACGYKSHYLGNVEDAVILKDASGATVATKSWSFENGYYLN
ncbi:lamin tail domain-containing protein [Nonomuraea sp. NPDC050202]|uniref:lamin tail domain-containing protein n=1 Tax=Nonomuraea sp. NPDC050202 TaxID=3155035 RepID=UPI0033C0232D